jgi:hypothetical protein
MKFLVGVMLAISVLGCASFKQSFQGGEPPLATAIEYTNSMDQIIVIVEDNDFSMYCSLPDAGNARTCTVGYGYLELNIVEKWEFLSPSAARELCHDGLRSGGSARPDEIQACSFALLRIRFTKLVPEDMGKDF